MKLIKKISLITTALLVTNCTSKAPTINSSRLTASSDSIESCYQIQEGRVYFTTSGSEACQGDVFYDGPRGSLMIDVDTFEDGSTIHRQGVPRIYTNKHGDQFFLSAWENGAKAKTLTVVKVDMASKKADVICTKQNYWNQFDVKEDNGGNLKLKIRHPKDSGTAYKTQWVDCK